MRMILKLIGGLVFVAAVLVGGLLLLPADRVARIASDQLSAQLGREVTLETARIALWPELGLSGEGLRVANADWAGPLPLLEARAVSLGLDPIDALAGRISVRRATIEAPLVRLETDAQGRRNWQGSGTTRIPVGGATNAGGGGAATSVLSRITLDRVRLQDGTAVFASPEGETRIDAMDLGLRWPDPSAPLEADLRLSRDGAPLRVEASLAAPAALASGGSSGLTLGLETPGGDAAFEGRVTAGRQADGTVTLDLSDTALAARSLGAIGVSLPEGLGRSVRGSATLALTDGPRVTLSSGAFRLDGNALRLDGSLDLSAKPRVSARIDADALDLSGLSAGQDGSAAGQSAANGAGGGTQRGWPRTLIDASALGLFDGDVTLSAGSLAFGDFRFGATRVGVTLQDSRAVMELRDLSGYGGTITGTAVANNRNGFSARLDVALAGVEMRSLLGAALGIDRFEGPLTGAVSLLGVGDTLDALMRSLDGDGRITAGPGVINGIDLDRAFAGSPTGGTTIFTTATGTFRVERGVLLNDDLALDLPVLEAAGDGRIDLGGQSIDYVLSVGDPRARGGRGIVLPVRLKGPWTDVSIRLDGERAMEQNLSDEREALEGRVRDRVAEELGVTPQEGESTEDMLRRELEDRVRDGILDLLGR